MCTIVQPEVGSNGITYEREAHQDWLKISSSETLFSNHEEALETSDTVGSGFEGLNKQKKYSMEEERNNNMDEEILHHNLSTDFNLRNTKSNLPSALFMLSQAGISATNHFLPRVIVFGDCEKTLPSFVEQLLGLRVFTSRSSSCWSIPLHFQLRSGSPKVPLVQLVCKVDQQPHRTQQLPASTLAPFLEALFMDGTLIDPTDFEVWIVLDHQNYFDMDIIALPPITQQHPSRTRPSYIAQYLHYDNLASPPQKSCNLLIFVSILIESNPVLETLASIPLLQLVQDLKRALSVIGAFILQHNKPNDCNSTVLSSPESTSKLHASNLSQFVQFHVPWLNEWYIIHDIKMTEADLSIHVNENNNSTEEINSHTQVQSEDCALFDRDRPKTTHRDMDALLFSIIQKVEHNLILTWLPKVNLLLRQRQTEIMTDIMSLGIPFEQQCTNKYCARVMISRTLSRSDLQDALLSHINQLIADCGIDVRRLSCAWLEKLLCQNASDSSAACNSSNDHGCAHDDVESQHEGGFGCMLDSFVNLTRVNNMMTLVNDEPVHPIVNRAIDTLLEFDSTTNKSEWKLSRFDQLFSDLRRLWTFPLQHWIVACQQYIDELNMPTIAQLNLKNDLMQLFDSVVDNRLSLPPVVNLTDSHANLRCTLLEEFDSLMVAQDHLFFTLWCDGEKVDSSSLFEPTPDISVAISNSIEGILAIMKSSMKAPVQSKGCDALRNLSRSKDTRVAAVAAGAVPVIIDAMKMHADNPSLLHSACLALRNMSCEEACRAAITCANGLHVVLGAMENNKDVADLQAEGCGILWNVVIHPMSRRYACAWGGIQTVISSMRTYLAVFDVQRNGCGFLWNISLDSEYHDLLMDAGSVDTLLAALKAHNNDNHIEQHAFGTLSVLAATANNRAAITSLELISSLLRSLQHSCHITDIQRPQSARFKTSEALLEQRMQHPLSLLYYLATDATVAEHVVKEDGVAILLSCLQVCSAERVVTSVCGIFWNLSMQDISKIAITSKGVIDTLINIVNQYDSAHVQIKASGALLSLLVAKEVREQINSEPVVLATIKSMTNHKTVYHVQKNGCRILQCCATSKRIKKLLVTNGGMEVIVEAMFGEQKDVSLQESGLKILVALARCKSLHNVIKPNVDRIVEQIMPFHADNPKILEYQRTLCSLLAT
eukprot:gene9162-1454_t